MNQDTAPPFAVQSAIGNRQLAIQYSLCGSKRLRLVKIDELPLIEVVGFYHLPRDRGAEGLAASARSAVGQQRPEERQPQFPQINGQLCGIARILYPQGRYAWFIARYSCAGCPPENPIVKHLITHIVRLFGLPRRNVNRRRSVLTNDLIAEGTAQNNVIVLWRFFHRRPT